MRPVFSLSGFSPWCLSLRRMEFPTGHVNSMLELKSSPACKVMGTNQFGMFVVYTQFPFSKGLRVWGGLSPARRGRSAINKSVTQLLWTGRNGPELPAGCSK